MSRAESKRHRHRAKRRADVPRRWSSPRRVAAVTAPLLVGAVAVTLVVTQTGGADDAVPASGALLEAPVASTPTSSAPAPTEAGSSSPATTVQTVVPGKQLKKKSKKQLLAEEAQRIAARSFTFQIGTFNVLGSNHTAPGGDRRSYPPASARNGGAISRILSNGVDVIGMQELKQDQLNAITSGTGMSAYPSSGDTDNAILWDPDRFELVDTGYFSITFMHRVRPQTVLRLKDRETGREAYFVNMHTSAGHGPRYTASRRAGLSTAVREINELKASGLPVFLTGDMNDREAFFCQVAPPTGMVAAIGGSTSGGCRPAGALAVDWVMGTSDVDFSGYVEDRSTLGRVSDHHFVAATATVAGQD